MILKWTIITLVALAIIGTIAYYAGWLKFDKIILGREKQ